MSFALLRNSRDEIVTTPPRVDVLAISFALIGSKGYKGGTLRTLPDGWLYTSTKGEQITARRAGRKRDQSCFWIAEETEVLRAVINTVDREAVPLLRDAGLLTESTTLRGLCSYAKSLQP